MYSSFILVLALLTTIGLHAQGLEPIIDMHLHALRARAEGPPPVFICAPYESFPAWDPKTGPAGYTEQVMKTPPCAHPIRSAMTDDELMKDTLAMLERYNITGVTSGPLEVVERWKQTGGERILPAVLFSAGGKAAPQIETLRKAIQDGKLMALGEVVSQYGGIGPSDPAMEPYLALAEELDVPVGIHIGPGPPGAPYIAAPQYRSRLSSMLQLEEALVKHPKLRVWACHAGWPMVEDTLAVLYAHPQVYVDIGVISYIIPPAEFYSFLRRLVDAGFENRIMFGSDQMVWPATIELALKRIQDAPFLSKEQKRDILYNNAARFLRLKAK